MIRGFGDLAAQILKIISNPASNLTGAMLMLAMVVLVLLILAVAALVTILPGDDDEEEDARPELVGAEEELPARTPVRSDAEEAGEGEPAGEPPPRTDEGRSSRLLVLLPAVLLIAAAVWGWQAAGSPRQCSSCHASAAASATWAKGDHRNVTCTACHEDGGIGLLPAIVTRAANGIASFGGVQTVEHRRPVPAYRCLRCHAALTSGVLAVGRIKVRHSDLLSAGYDCSRCHTAVGHAAAGTPERAVDMNQCVSCHDGKKAPAACSTCHVGDPSSAIRTDRAVYPRVDITPRPGCSGCHETKTCTACHGLTMPHPVGFDTGKGHARLAVFEGKDKVCFRCHRVEDCRKCHKGDFSAHGSDWKVRHPSGVPLDGRNVCACHDSANFCGLCHVTSGKRR